MARGGYHIIDFKNKPFSSANRTNDYDPNELYEPLKENITKYKKPVFIENLNIEGVNNFAIFVGEKSRNLADEPRIAGSTIVITIHNYVKNETTETDNQYQLIIYKTYVRYVKIG